MRKTLAGVILGLALLAFAAAPAFGHAVLKSSTPAKGADVAAAPTEVALEFTEPPTGDSRIEVYDACGNEVDGADSVAQNFGLSVSVGSDTAGTYEVEYFVISGQDGHPTRGGFKFEVTDGKECVAASDPGDDAGGGAGLPTDPEEPTGLFDFPVGGLLVALGASVLIGAAGGVVYAGIMGPPH